jgi:acetolactate synthase-1/2/3 large subunit
MQTNAQLLIATLRALGISHVFTNAGTDTAPIIEALTQQKPVGLEFHVVPHENLALAMAYGYYRASGAMAAVLVHTTVGTANALMGTMNASRDRTPVLVLAGRTPNTEGGQLGSRSAHIHWGQDSFDQGAGIREWCKWDGELRSGQALAPMLSRAVAIARSEPCGPVYLTLPREVLAAPASSEHAEFAMVHGSAPDPDSLQEIASALLKAEFPLLITSAGGRDPAAFAAIETLSSEYAVPVAQPFATDANLSSDKTMNFGMEGMNLVREADLVLVLEAAVPWLQEQPKAYAQVVQIAADPLYADYPVKGHRASLSVAATPRLFLQSLLTLLGTLPKPDVSRRRQLLAELAAKRRKRQLAQIQRVKTTRPIDPAWLAHCLNAAKSDNSIVINEMGVNPDLLELRQPRSYLREPTSGGLGFGLGAALGAKLAQPERQVTAIVGDGSYMFGNPTPAHFTAAALKLGTLTVINNNGSWKAVADAARAMYPQGALAAATDIPLSRLTPAPAYEKLVEACDGHGERVEKPSELQAAIERGLKAADQGIPSVLNVITGN